MGGAVRAVSNTVSNVFGGGNKGPSAAEVAANQIIAQNNASKAAAPNAAPTLSAAPGMGGPMGAGGPQRKAAAGVGANMLTGNLGDASSNVTATKKLLGS